MARKLGKRSPSTPGVELPQGVKPVDDHRLREIMSGYAEYHAADLFETRSLAYEVRNWRMAALSRETMTEEEREALKFMLEHVKPPLLPTRNFALEDKFDRYMPVLRRLAARGRP